MNSARLSTCCQDAPVDFAAMTELRKKYLQLYCKNWNKSWYSVCFTSSDGHFTHKRNQNVTLPACTAPEIFYNATDMIGLRPERESVK